jgi:ZIP family zinc transporter
VYSVFGMLATGLGALPFWFSNDFNKFSKRYIGVANAIAAGVMISASFGLIQEGFEVAGNSEPQTIIGVLIGLVIIWLCHHLIDKKDIDVGHLHGADARRALLVLAIMTIHSFAEGMGIGLSFCGSKGARTGRTIAVAIGVHNIPEGLAIALVLLPKGESVLMTTIYCILSSAPQPLISIPSFIMVQYFTTILPFGFGIAAGAMLWLTVAEILPEAFEDLQDSSIAASVVVMSMAAMAGFQSWIHTLM